MGTPFGVKWSPAALSYAVQAVAAGIAAAFLAFIAWLCWEYRRRLRMR